MGAARFCPARPATWTWAALNAWLMARGRTPVELRRALKAEAKFRRLTYQLRIQARLGRLESALAKRALVDGKSSPGRRASRSRNRGHS